LKLFDKRAAPLAELYVSRNRETFPRKGDFPMLTAITSLGAMSLALGMTFATTLSAQEGDASMGLSIAEEYCASCHNVGVDGPFKLDPPSFAAIGTYRSAEQIRERIVRPIHDDMPQYTDYMIGGNIDDMVAYIVSLEK
jgi:mono/diheme cytochrome c family protein